MSTIDPRLGYLIKSADTLAPQTAGHLGLATEEAAAPAPVVDVLVRLRAEGVAREEALAALAEAGMKVRAGVAGPYTVVSGEVPLDRLNDIELVGGVRRVEASRPLTSELDRCIPEVRADVPHSSTPAIRGAGTIIGVIDTGIDFRHGDFLNEDGSTRIRLLWDQNAAAVPGAAVPYGREYTAAQINAALDGTAAASDVPRADVNGHGTHVCGIAAGCGRARSTHLGLAPEAEVIVVALSTSDATTLGRSVPAFEAFAYVVDKADGTPVAINFSMGMNGGGHCGETVLETALDNYARRRGVAIVKSAGNEQQMRIHAGGTLAEDETRELRMEVRDNDLADDIVEVWFADSDEVSVAVAPPGGAATPFVARGGEEIFNTQSGNSVSIDLDADAEGTGDTVATIILSRGTSNIIQPGSWRILLRAGAVTARRFDAWIEQTRAEGSGEQTRFAESSTDPTRTITVPGTARNIITVGSYVTRLSNPPDAPVGAVSLFSGRGPTRYDQLKPELVAPGEVTEAARAGSQGVTLRRGTSMAAPVVTGAAALILSQRPGLTCAQLKQILTRTARRTGAAAGAPDSAWGFGKLDVQAALELARHVRFPVISNIRVEEADVSWETDVETTGALRFLPNRRQLLLGKNTRSMTDLTFARSHRLTLAAEPAGVYFCQIIAFSSDNFFTEEDDAGLCFEVHSSGVVTLVSPIAPASLLEVAAPEVAALLESTVTAGRPARASSKTLTPLAAKQDATKKRARKKRAAKKTVPA